ncbi:MAG: tagatose-bisphosphate aldolase [Candidatus Harrisonbacteria bacterium RIFCSPLOWO2_02_FULL_41_13b]|uniref:Tagatose-bisphosphate aldolase n=1 Tax=Candidatus Harrisonbacteria bacterium RIFCSPLOWO2_02_FULL_41_13b TaxID=1798409 RepID=A0A1G1ZST5_9BACT|nr:MAG: tagatose-bisphosphate aldolase [Candidatus Harrisonbacteria bacterium RIFCSPHIGHO2_02_FULL_40_20]OGY66820.1 MAG: tagatose-bisphosphate aldolase [Candidatus Harrisonbacteria bacterium RIFCSPLOWO2_02_FULL_41_13b]
MMTLKQIIEDAEQRGIALGHFNISEFVALKAILEGASQLNVPIIIGVSEGEREFIGIKETVALVRAFREEYSVPIFLNADHTHSLEAVEEVAKAGFDAVLFDASKEPLEKNIKLTKEAVLRAKILNPNILVEGEIGYIGASSKILQELPKDISLEEKDLPTAEEVAEFVQKTKVDLLAPAVGNIHGILANIPNPRLNIKKVREMKQAAKIPLVLHGGSGIADDDFRVAIKAGISTIHINTEIRVAWRKGVEMGLKRNRDEVAPYKILSSALEGIKEIVLNRLRIFNGL